MLNLLPVFCETFGVSQEKAVGKKLTRDITTLRYMLWLYAHERCDISYVAIAKTFKRTYRGILKSIRTLRGLLQFDKKIKADYDVFRKKMDAALEINATPDKNI